MKNLFLILAALFACSVCQAQYFDGNHPGYILLGRSSPLDGYGLTNLTSMVYTNSAAGFLASGTSQKVGAAGVLTVTVILTNTQIVWVTNLTSGINITMGNTIGFWTNYDNANLFCNAGDSVLVTNISGSGGAGIVGSWYQVLH